METQQTTKQQLIPELLTALKLGKGKTNCVTTAKEGIEKNMKMWVKLRKAEAQEEAQDRGQDSKVPPACLGTWLLPTLRSPQG